MKYMVQARLFRKEHPDIHYASAIFRYQRHLAVQFREVATYVYLDDKHTCKVGEPNFPVAAVDRGKRIIVALNRKFAVGNHNHTKYSIVPSVIMLAGIPDTISGSFYCGRIFIGIKNAIFEASSQQRHALELSKVLDSQPGLCYSCALTEGLIITLPFW